VHRGLAVAVERAQVIELIATVGAGDTARIRKERHRLDAGAEACALMLAGQEAACPETIVNR
jgi:hypothetical protein